MHIHQYTLCLIATLLLLSACSTPTTGGVTVIEAVNGSGDAGFARVTEPRPFRFPDDMGPHPQYQTEWWYFTGNLTADTGDHFGYHVTFFRRGLTPGTVERDSAWGTNQVYMAHMAITDVARGKFYHFERFSRGSADLAGASSDPFRVFVEDWQARGLNADASQIELAAQQDGVALRLRLDSQKPPALQGEQGYSRKGQSVGNASYYYSFTRLAASGTIQIKDARYAVQGYGWMDREFGTSALEATAQGWDWFSIQLDNDYELMLFQIRTSDPALARYDATLIAPDGSTRRLAATSDMLVPQGTWRSPHTGASYPSGWQITLPAEQIALQLTPHLRDQEMNTSIAYWEGAVAVQGTWAGAAVQGNGYVELTGYASQQASRY